MRAKAAWARIDGVVVDACEISSLGRFPGLVLGLAHDHVQADAELDACGPSVAARSRTSAIFFATAAGGSPQVR